MTSIGRALTAALAIVGGISGGALGQPQPMVKPPVESFAVLPAEPPHISPDGSRFALIRGVNGRPAVAVYQVDAPQQPPQIIASDSWVVRALRWAKNDVLLTYDSKNEKTGLFDILRPFGDIVAITLSNGQMKRLTSLARIDDVDLDSSNTMYATYANWLFRIDLRGDGHPQVVMKQDPRAGDGAAARWFMDGHGNVVGRVDWRRDEKDGIPFWHSTLEVLEKDTWRALDHYDATVGRGDGVVGVSEDGAFIRLAPESTGTVPIDRVDIATGAETKLFQDPNYDVAAPLVDEWTGRIIGYAIDEDMPVYRYFDPKREALQQALEHAFPNLSVHPVSEDLSGNRAIVEVEGPKTPASYYLYDRTTHRATAVAAGYPDLTESEMGDVKPYGYASRDGLHIPAYLTLPPGKPPHDLPLVVLPHGGPDLRDDMRFDFLRQFLANRGYAMLTTHAYRSGVSVAPASVGDVVLHLQSPLMQAGGFAGLPL